MNDSVETATVDAGEAAPGVPASARLLLKVVYIMGIILVLLFMTLIGGIIYKSTQKSVPKPVPPAAALNLSLPAGTDIRSVEIDGDRLVLSTGREVIVIDIRKNAIVSRITVGP
jgi:hypothetical protein